MINFEKLHVTNERWDLPGVALAYTGKEKGCILIRTKVKSLVKYTIERVGSSRPETHLQYTEPVSKGCYEFEIECDNGDVVTHVKYRPCADYFIQRGPNG